MDLKSIREYFYKNNDYVIRIREKSEDIVYYNGIKAFKINKTNSKRKEETIEVIPNVFMISDSLVRDIRNKNENIKDDKLKQQVVESIKQTRNEIGDLLVLKKDANIKLNESKSENYNDSFKKDTLHNIEEYLFIEKKYKKYFEFDIEKLNKTKTKYNKYYILKKDIELSDIKELVEIEYDIIDYFINGVKNKNISNENGWAKPDINLYEAKEIKLSEIKCIDKKLVLIDDGKKKVTDDNIKNAIDKYESFSFETEKYYQHQFMKHEDIKNKIKNFNNIFRFEEEYYTFDTDDDGDDTGEMKKIIEGFNSTQKRDRGRIDNIFLDIDNKGEADLYLIELKYGASVIDGSNGVNKHLIDIKKLIENKKKKYLFFKKIQSRVNYRLNNIPNNNISNIEKFKSVHFWTFIGYDDNKEEYKKSIILNLLNELNGTQISKNCTRGQKDKCKTFKDVIENHKLPKKQSKELYLQIRDLEEKEIEIENLIGKTTCDVQFFLDKTNYIEKPNDKIDISKNKFEQLIINKDGVRD